VQGASCASVTEASRSKLPSLGTTAWIVAIVLIAAYLLMTFPMTYPSVHNAEEKAARTQRTPGPRVPATVDQKPPADCAKAKNIEECADTASGQPTNCYTVGNQTYCYSYEPPPPYRPTEPTNDSGYGGDYAIAAMKPPDAFEEFVAR
jgi:hypothetical protein